jgi:hypothetical protein
MKKGHYSVLRASLISIILSATCAMTQQKLPEFLVTDLITNDLSAKAERGIERRNELWDHVKLTVYEISELDSLLNEYPETVSSIWSVVDDGCSWYCSGGNYLVTASSSLKSNTSINYNPKAANDLSYKTAWVEGKEDEGIGEYIEYTFGNESPRITSIIISNGYVKSDKAWTENNRVKKIKLYVNETEFGILNLLDTKNDQLFQLGTFGHNTDGSDLVLKFEIAEVYKGLKYNDTVITEIYFDGMDVH